MEYISPDLENILVVVEKGYEESQLPERNPVGW